MSNKNSDTYAITYFLPGTSAQSFIGSRGGIPSQAVQSGLTDGARSSLSQSTTTLHHLPVPDNVNTQGENMSCKSILLF